MRLTARRVPATERDVEIQSDGGNATVYHLLRATPKPCLNQSPDIGKPTSKQIFWTLAILSAVIWSYLYTHKGQRCNRWGLGMDRKFHPRFCWPCDFLSLMGFKWIRVNKGVRNSIFTPYPCFKITHKYTYGYVSLQATPLHYSDIIMGAMASQITSLTIVYSTVYSSANQRKHQSSASLAFVRGFHQWPVKYPHRWPVTRKMFPFDDVIVDNVTHSLHSVSGCIIGNWLITSCLTFVYVLELIKYHWPERTMVLAYLVHKLVLFVSSVAQWPTWFYAFITIESLAYRTVKH